MNKVVHREASFWGRSTIVILAGGYAFVMVSVMENNKSVAIIHDLIVHESRRRKGLGAKLLKEAITEAGNMGADTLRLSVEPGSWTQGWYGRNGFVRLGETELDNHPCVIMERDLMFNPNNVADKAVTECKSPDQYSNLTNLSRKG